MVDFERGARERELEARTRAFIRDVVIPRETEARSTAAHGPPEELLRELRAAARRAGLLTPQIGERWGGYGLTHLETATVFRAAGYSMLGPLAMNCMAPDEGNMHLLEKIATPEQQDRYLKPLAAGDVRSAFFMTEPDGAGSDPSMLRTTARQDGDHWVISGRKWFVSGAQGARFGIIMARTGEHATMFLVDLPAPGLTIERLLDTLGRSMPGGHAVVRLEDVRVTRAQVLGEVNEGFRYAQMRLAPARLSHCMRWWGAAQRAHDIATEYACTRHGFGKPLIDHEGVGFMLADSRCELLQTQLLIDHTAWLLDRGERAGTESSMTKYVCAESFFRIVDRCVQILGGIGVTDETPVASMYTEMRAFRIYDGPSEVHRWSIANKVKRDWQSR